MFDENPGVFQLMTAVVGVTTGWRTETRWASIWDRGEINRKVVSLTRTHGQ